MTAHTEAAAEGAVISLPKGGGAISGAGEKFSADPFTGAATFTVPIALPPGRAGLSPHLSLGYGTTSGNGAFGLGWQLSIPGVARRTSRGIPRYVDSGDRADVFMLSGTEDLVPVAGTYPGRVRYRPRTEGLFARIEHVRDGSGDYWEVRSKDGLFSRYGTPCPGGVSADADWRDPAVVADPADPGRVFGWRVTETKDPMGNRIRYEYLRDAGAVDGHRWDHPLLSRISYVDYGDPANPLFLVEVEFDYEARPDPFAEYRPGFEVRTTLRCSTVRLTTRAADGIDRVAREYRLGYQQAAFNGVSLLTRLDVVGVDGLAEESIPPLTFAYSEFAPAGKRFQAVDGPALPTVPLNDPALALVDVRGIGLPDLVELGARHQVWPNAGGGRFGFPRQLAEAPPYSLEQPGVQLLDANGDGRPDLVVSTALGSGRSTATAAGGAMAGYFPMAFARGWSRHSFQPYRQSPSVRLADPNVKLVDLDGDGLTDVLRGGTRLECWFNDPDPRLAWQRTTQSDGTGPPVDLADPRVRLADMTGDGLSDIVRVHSGNITYWPNLGHGDWGAPVTMRRSPRLPDRFDPHRVLIGDVDGDGAADLVYVDSSRVLLWGNQSGHAWSEQPVTINGTPRVADTDALRLTDLNGSGMTGLLFDRAGERSGQPFLRFLDFSGGVKPYLLSLLDNNLGATTRVTYTPSTREFLRDDAHPATRWQTTLPFPVQVVSRVELTDEISGGRVTTSYRYHHGYWDGVEREFRGFAMVEQFDTEQFDTGQVQSVNYSPPTLTRTWFHSGPVAAAEAGDWTELDLRAEYSAVDPPMLQRPAAQTAFLAGLPRGARRAALRTLRGRSLRTEVYALDGDERQRRPYEVTETVSGLREEASPDGGERIFFPFLIGTRTTRWERGIDPMTQFTFPAGYDAYGMLAGQLAVAVPRGRDPMATATGTPAPYLSTYTVTEYAQRDDTEHYLVDRVARVRRYEVVDNGNGSVQALRDAVLSGTGPALRVLGEVRTYYDGDAFTGLPLGVLGKHGLTVRSESLAFTDDFLDTLFPGGDRPTYLDPGGGTAWPAEYPQRFRDLLPALAGYVHDTSGAAPGYYIVTARHEYDVHLSDRVARGLPVVSLDPMGAANRIDYDAHDLLPVRSTDPAGLATLADNDYRTLQPRVVTDANGNTTTVTYSPAGLVATRRVSGKNGEGDRDEPGVRMSYDLLAFAERAQPASVRTVKRVHHDTDTAVPAGQRDEVIVSVEYSDGFGRTLQTRTQAEDTLFGDPVFGNGVLPPGDGTPAGDVTGRTRGPGDPDNVVVSGWKVYDNKAQVVRQYEPFYSTGFDYAAPREAELGQHTTMFYDPRGQLLRTVHADGSEQRVVLGVPADLTDPADFTPTPWETYTYDANDNAGRTHGESAGGYRTHWNTPGSVEVDPLGRTVVAVARNGPTSADWFTTRTAYDIEGNLLSVTDPLGRVAVRYVFDLAKRRWRVDSIDAGPRLSVLDALGRPVEARDGKGALTLGGHDALHRPTHVWARDDDAGAVTLRQLVEYGDGGTADQPADARAAARAVNLLGRAVRHYDEAGLTSLLAADFKGNALESARRVVADAPILATYDVAQRADWRVASFRVDWTTAPGQSRADRDAELLEPAGYLTTISYDALNRPASNVFPADVQGHRATMRLHYNRAGSLDAVDLDGTPYVRRIAYDAKGRRALIAYGNGVLTRCAYDPHTLRLVRQRSERFTAPDPLTYHPVGDPVHDWGYGYDLAGNLLVIRDRAPGSGIPGNPDALSTTDPVLRQLLGSGDALDRQFTYEPVYRLRTATGREYQAPPTDNPWLDLPRGTDPTRAQAYTETYRYDPVGNLRSLEHAGTGGFVRQYTVAADSNRLIRFSIGSTDYDVAYDGDGNLVAETTSRHFAWNHADQLVAFATQTDGAEPSVHAQYLYDAAGRRVKKLVRRQGGAVDVTHYLNSTFEHHRWAGGENNHVHVMDGVDRIALVRAGTVFPGDSNPAVAFHLADHLASSTAILDGTGALLNREEYTPYGETSFGSYRSKRYRFTGCERDEESGLGYHRSRYYVPWTGRWSGCDPLGTVDGPNLYAYVRGNPLTGVDKTGTEDRDSRGTGGGSGTGGSTGGGGAVDVQDNQFDVHGKRGMCEMPLTMDIDEPLPVGQPGISTTEARSRALDVSNRQFLDSMTNRMTKFLGVSAQARTGARIPVSVVQNPHSLITHYFDEISEMREVFDQAVGKIRNPNSMTPTALKTTINHNIWEIIKTDQGAAASRVRTALNTIGFENVPGQGFVLRSPATASTSATTTGAAVLSLGRPSPPSTPKAPSVVRTIVTVENAAKALEYAGYAGYAYQMATAKTPAEAVKHTTDFVGGVGGAEVGALVGGALGVSCGPGAPICIAGGMTAGSYVGSHTDDIDWGEVAFIGMMILSCL